MLIDQNDKLCGQQQKSRKNVFWSIANSKFFRCCLIKIVNFVDFEKWRSRCLLKSQMCTIAWLRKVGIKKKRIWRCKFSCTFQSQKMSDMLQSKFMKAVQLLLHCVHLRHLHQLILRILILVLRRKRYGQNFILRLLEKVQEINAWQVELFVGTFWTFHLLISWSFREDYFTFYT